MESNLKLGKYQHFKGNFYEVLGVAKDSENLQELVVYKALYGEGQMWVRPLVNFLEEIEKDGIKTPRFKYIEE